MTDMEDRIIKVVELAAPVERVWRALTDHEEFSRWFRVRLDQPFVVGTVSTGMMTHSGCEHMPWLAQIERMDHERLFAFRWHDYDESLSAPIADQPMTLVEFQLEPTADGTRLTITESGFSALPDPRRLEVLRGNTEGWSFQAENIVKHVSS